jgi:hypothetical protein
MRLAQLRRQMLIAMGLPACWTQASAPPPAEPPPVAPIYTPSKKPPELLTFDSRACTIDTIVETICGRGDTEYCDGTAERVAASDSAGLFVTTVDEARVSGKDFILDDKASDAYVTRLRDLNEKLDGKPACCWSRCTTLTIGQANPLPVPVPPGHMRNEACIPEPPKGTSKPDQTNAECPMGVKIQNELRPYSQARNDQCCYASVQKRVIIRKGRPARVDGDPKFAALAGGDRWHAELSVDVSMSPEIRARLAASWLDAARLEHASIAAFSATSLRLMSFGAPPELIAATHRAALDEIEHARIAFALASAYGGTAISPGAFADAAAPAMDLRAFAVETFIDGCIGETAAALEAERAAATCVDPAVAAILRTIATDEARHAELAWQIVAWCVRVDPSILDDIREASDAKPLIDDDGDLAPYGVLGSRARRIAYDDVMRDVVAPCVAALAA